MPRQLVFGRFGARLGLALLAVLGGCAADSGDGGILVLKNVRADDMCVARASATELGITHGSLDLLRPTGYLFIAQMKSRITALAGQEDQRTIITTGARIDIAFPGSTLFSDAELAELRSSGLTHFKTLFSAPISPNGGITDAGFELIPFELVTRIRDKAPANEPFQIEAVATFTVEGEMSDSTVESQAFTYAVTIGTGVVINDLGLCSELPTSTMARTGYACNPSQDGVLDCCQASTGALTCPAKGTAMP